jgi:hypothetical protein
MGNKLRTYYTFPFLPLLTHPPQPSAELYTTKIS